MSRKTTPSRSKRSASTKKTSKAARKAKPKPSAARKAKPVATRTTRVIKPAASPSKKAARAAPARRGSKAAGRELSTSEVLARAELDVTAAIDTLNQQMNAALNSYTELASAQCGRGRAVVRTAPLDRATATFQRLVAEVVDEQLAEMLPPLVDLRNEMTQRLNNGPAVDSASAELYERGSQTLDHVLTIAGACSYEARTGEVYDPLIHLAVGEISRRDLADGVVGEPLQPGFRSGRGKVIVPAKVRVNRR